MERLENRGDRDLAGPECLTWLDTNIVEETRKAVSNTLTCNQHEDCDACIHLVVAEKRDGQNKDSQDDFYPDSLKEILDRNYLNSHSRACSGGAHDDDHTMLLDVERSRVYEAEEAARRNDFLPAFTLSEDSDEVSATRCEKGDETRTYQRNMS